MTLPYPNRSQVSPFLMLLLGVAIGWGLLPSRTPALRASGGDRSDESILTTGPTFTRYNEGTKVQVCHDAIYFLDHPAAKLIATIPSVPVLKPGVQAKFIDKFLERDLIKDFRLREGANPHFLMTTSSTWYGSSQAMGDGGSLLVVFETESKQIAVYKAEQSTYGPTAVPKLELIQIRPYRQMAAEPAQ